MLRQQIKIIIPQFFLLETVDKQEGPPITVHCKESSNIQLRGYLRTISREVGEINNKYET